MSRERTIERSTCVAAEPEKVWQHATRMKTINREISPWLKMTYPAEARELALSDVSDRLGELLFSSWVLLFGIFPVERMLLQIGEVGPGHRFVEESRMLFMRRWRHERIVEPAGGGTRITDRVTLEPRLPGVITVLAWLLGHFFAHRHRKLTAMFGAQHA
jgi:ligand-binding SRPBCC domain-containing protein